MHHRINISALIVIFLGRVLPSSFLTHSELTRVLRLVLKLAGLLPRVYSTCVLSPMYRLQRASSFAHLSRTSIIARSRPLQVFYYQSNPLHITVQVVHYTTTALTNFFSIPGVPLQYLNPILRPVARECELPLCVSAEWVV